MIDYLVFVYFTCAIFFIMLSYLSLKKKQGIMAFRWDMPISLISFVFSLLYYEALIQVTYEMVEMARYVPPWHLPTSVTLAALSLVGYTLLRYRRELPDIITALCISSLLLGCILCVMHSAQFHIFLGTDGLSLLLILYPLNVVVIYIRMICHKARKLSLKTRERSIQCRNPIINFCAKLLYSTPGCVFAAFLLMFPLFCIVIIVLVLSGQSHEAILKAFTL